MRTYGKVKIAFWEDDKISKIGDAQKLLALYLLTGEHSNAIGCYRLPLGYIQTDLRWDKEKAQSHLSELTKIGFLIYDDETEIIYIKNYLKHNPIENSKVGKMCVNLINSATRSRRIFPKLYEALIPLQNRFESRDKTFWDNRWNEIYLNLTKSESDDRQSDSLSDSVSNSLSNTVTNTVSHTQSFSFSLNSLQTDSAYSFGRVSDSLSDSVSDTQSQNKNFFAPQNQKKKKKDDLENFNEVDYENNTKLYSGENKNSKKRTGGENISEALASCIDKRKSD